MSLTDPGPTVLHVGETDPPDPFRASGTGQVLVAENTADALETISEGSVDCVVVDTTATDVARRVREHHPTIPLVVRTGAGPLTVATGDLPGLDGLWRPDEVDWTIGGDRGTRRTDNADPRDEGAGTAEWQFGSTPDPSRVLDALEDGVYALDTDLRFVAVNDALVELTGYDRAELLGEHVSFVLDDLVVEDARDRLDTVGEDRERERRFEAELRSADGGRLHVEAEISAIETDGTPAGIVGVVHDGTRGLERVTAGLQDWTRRMARAEDPDGVVAAVDGAVRALFDESHTGVYTLEDGALALVDGAENGDGTGEAEGTRGLPPVLTDGPVWDVFVSGEPRTSEPPDGEADQLGASLVYPLGTYGVVVVGWGREERLKRDRIELAAVLAANAETALDRAAVEGRLRERERRLTARNEELARLDRTNAIIRGVHRALISAESREAGRAAVADWLTDADPYALAWFAEVTGSGDGVEPLVGGGDVGRTYVDTVRDRLDGSPLAALVADAATTDEVRVRSDVLADPDWVPFRPDALAHGYRSVAAVPVTVSGRIDSVLVIHGIDPEAFPSAEAEVLSELGGLVGRTLRTLDRAGVGSPDHRVTVEIEIPSRQLVFSRIAAEVGVPVTLEGSVPLSDGAVMSFVSAPVEGGRLAEAFGANDAVSEVTVIDDAGDDGGALVELRKPNCRLTTLVHDAGGRLHSVTATADGASATLDLPPDVEVRTVVEAIDTAYPGTTLRSRREVIAPELPRTVRAALHDRCTDRQYEALTGAYYSGYYDWPRRTTAGDLADRAGVSSPTFQRHLRIGERRLLDIVLGE